MFKGHYQENEKVIERENTFTNYIFLYNLSQPCNPTPMYIYWRELKTYLHIKMFIEILTEILFIVVPKWKQPKCPATNEWIKQNAYDGQIYVSIWLG